MTTAKSDGWIVMRCRVSLAGRVTGADGGIATGGALSLTAADDGDRQKATSPPPDRPRRYDTHIRWDGFYFFLDLPAGDYVLNGQDESGNPIAAQRVSIVPADGSGPLDVIGADLSASTKSDPGERPPRAEASAGPTTPRRGARSGSTIRMRKNTKR
jgi:hypothetical protein